MPILTHFVRTDITQRSTTSLTAVELTNYTVAWTDLTAAGFAAGDDVLILVACKIGNSNANYNSSFCGWFRHDLRGAELDDTRPTVGSSRSAGSVAAQYQWFDRKTLVVNENIYFSGMTNGGTAQL